jgi:hypothetical protein
MGFISTVGSILLNLVFLAAALMLPAFYLLGAERSTTYILQPLSVAAWVALFFTIILLLPLSMFKKLRPYTGAGIYMASHVFGLAGWAMGFIGTWILWSGWAAIGGTVLLGGAVVPFALVASAIEGLWTSFFLLLGLTALTFISRVVGLAIAESGERHKPS